MSTLTYRATNADGEQSLSVFGSTWEKAIAGSHPNFTTLVAYLASNSDHDEEYVRGLVDPTVGIAKALGEHFGDRLTYDLYHLYLDGFPMQGGLADVIKTRLHTGDQDWLRFAKFLVNLENNPSYSAREAVWEWVEKHGVSITDDGGIVGYKGLVNGTDKVTGENVPVSVHTGPNNFIDGVLYGEPGVPYQVPHRVGSTISKRRGDVDDNRSQACSTGLHVGAYSYAKTFGENREDGARYSTMGRVSASLPDSTFALVAFNPADVVSVPDGDLDWKIRVSKYEVLEFLEEVSDTLRDKSSYDHPDKVVVPVSTPAPFLPAGQEETEVPTVEPTPEPVVEEIAPIDSDVKTWEIFCVDNLGECIYETITGTEEDAQEVLEVHDPTGEDGYDYREVEVYDDLGNVPNPDDGLYGDDIDENWDGVCEDDGTNVYSDDDQVFPDDLSVFPDDLSEEGVPLDPSESLTVNAMRHFGLRADLFDTEQGHKQVARTWSNITTESSVRRWRKAHNVKPKSALRKALG